MNLNVLITAVLFHASIESATAHGNYLRNETSLAPESARIKQYLAQPVNLAETSSDSNADQTSSYHSAYMEDLEKYVHDQNVKRYGRASSFGSVVHASDLLPAGATSSHVRRVAGVNAQGRITPKQYPVQPQSVIETWSNARQDKLTTLQKAGSRILYSIQTSPKTKYLNKVDAILKTWAKDLSPDQIQVVGTHAPSSGSANKAHWDSAPLCGDSHLSCSCKDVTGILNAFNANHEFSMDFRQSEVYNANPDWLVLVGDDNYVDTTNVQEVLDSKDPDVPVIYGIPGCGAGTCPGHTGPGLCGGGGQIFSRGALRELMRNGQSQFREQHEKVNVFTGYWGDVATACVATNRNNPIPIKLLPGLNAWLLTGDKMKVALENKPLTFHYVTPKAQSFIQSSLEQMRKTSINLSALEHEDETLEDEVSRSRHQSK